MKLLLLLCLIATFNAYAIYPFVGPQKVGRSDSGIYGPSYQVMTQNMLEFATSNPQYAQTVNIGQTETGVNTFGIILNRKVETKKMIFISGATHGNEYLNIVDRLPTEILKTENNEFKTFMDQGGSFLILPVLNPDGYTSRRRENSRGQDLNRDFSNIRLQIERFNHKETQNAARWVDEFLVNTGAQFKLSLDYHCCYYGALLFPWAHTDNPIPQVDLDRHNRIGELMNIQFPGAEYGPTGDIIWYLADGTSKDYWYGKYGSVSGTYEGRYRDEKNNLPQHVAWLKDLVSEQ